MDIHVHGNPRLHKVHNGYHQAPHSKDDGLQFLSLEEQECILFFEETIGSLEGGLEDDSTSLSVVSSTPAEGLRTAASPAVSSIPITSVPPNLIEHDIIDLVHTTPDYTLPDFQRSAVTQSHFEKKPQYDSAESSTSSDGSEESSYHPPPGSIPTPVIIANRIAEQQITSGTSSLPTVLVERKQSLERPHSPLSKRGPATQAKPPRLPDNIHMMVGSKEPTPQSIATAAVNMHERRSLMLANLPPSAHPLEGGEPACVRNPSTRSVSFTGSTADKSRMEALSILGLPTSNTKTEGSNANSASSKVANDAKTSSNSVPTYNSVANNANISPNTTVNQKTSSPYKVSTSTDIDSNSANGSIIRNNNISPNTTMSQRRNSSTFTQPSSDVSANSYGGKTAVITPATTDKIANDKKPMQRSAEVTQSDFNSYGGKTIVMHPTASFRGESVPSPSSPPGKAEPAEIQVNSFGGLSRVISPSSPTDLPDGPACRPRSHSHSPSNTINCSDLHSPTGVKSRIFPPSVQHPARDEAQPNLNSLEDKHFSPVLSPSHTDPTYQPIIRSRPGTAPPMTAPKPQRPSGSFRPRPDPIPTEIRSKPPPKSSYRTQGITVQFSGKGATDEARRDALRKLGLLKNNF